MRWKDEDQILAFAQRLEGMTLNECESPYRIEELREYGGKGGFGQYLENAYFGLETNSLSRPDFYPVKLELKATPLKKSGSKLAPKERLVLGMINYMDIVKEPSFEESHFLEKNAALLIIWYVHDSAKSYGELQITLADIWRCLKEDGPQIKKDWELIAGKIKAGKAEELSEGDTLFLGAATKGATAESSYREQPNSDVPAKQRAFCFKIQYMRTIYSRMLDRKNKREAHPLQWFCKPRQSIEDAFKERFSPYVGMSTSELKEKLSITGESKDLYSRIVLSIIGCKKRNFEPYYDLMAGGVQLKTVRLEENGKNKESMSFPAFKYCELANEESFEDSLFYQQITCKFIIPVFRKLPGFLDEYYLDRICVWNMPQRDLDVVKGVWEDTRDRIRKGDYSHFMKLSDNRIAHVRTHGANAADKMVTPQGTMEVKRCFWLNASYVREEILERPVLYKI